MNPRNDPPAPAARTWGWLPDLLVLLLLCVLAWKLTYGITSVRDIWIGDETAYLIGAAAIPTHGMPAPEAGPLYLFWYLLLSRMPVDVLYVTHFNWACLAGLLAIAFYALLRCLACSRPWALLAAVLLLSCAIIDVLPQPMHLAAIALALGAALATRLRSPVAAFTAVGLTLLVATYVRPEYSLSLILYGVVAAGLAAGLLLRRPELRKEIGLAALTLTVAAAAFVFVFRFPSMNGERSFVAFGQHYAFNLSEAGRLEGNPWHEWQAAVRRDFGDVHSFSEALRSNPRAVLWHVGRNLRTLPGSVRAMLPVHLDLSPRGTLALSVALWSTLALGIGGLCWRLYRHGLTGSANRSLTIVLVLMAFLLVPALIQSLLIHPRQHYLLPMTIFVLAILTASVPLLPCRWPAWLTAREALVALALLAAVGVPNRVHGWNAQKLLGWRGKSPTVADQDLIPSIRLLRKSGVTGPVVLLEHAYYGWARSFYVPQQHQLLFHTEKTEGFQEFLRKHDVGVVMLSPMLGEDSRYATDPEFRRFIKEKGGKDFTVLRMPHGLTRVAVRNDLLPAAPRTQAARRP